MITLAGPQGMSDFVTIFGEKGFLKNKLFLIKKM